MNLRPSPTTEMDFNNVMTSFLNSNRNDHGRNNYHSCRTRYSMIRSSGGDPDKYQCLSSLPKIISSIIAIAGSLTPIWVPLWTAACLFSWETFISNRFNHPQGGEGEDRRGRDTGGTTLGHGPRIGKTSIWGNGFQMPRPSSISGTRDTVLALIH